MTQLPHDVVVECDEVINRPPPIVWKAVAPPGSGAAAVPASAVEQRPGRGPGADDVTPAQQGLEVMRPSAEMFMEQRVIDRQDEVMVLRMAMTRSFNMPWSAYESTIRVEPVPRDPSRSRVVLTCLATPSDDEGEITELLRGLMLLSLRSLKARVEKT